MQRLINILFLIICFGCASCSGGNDDNNGGYDSNNDDENVTLTCDPTSISAEAGSGSYTISVKTSGSKWDAYCADSKWITVTKSGANTSAGTVTVTVEQNSGNKRTGNVIVTSGNARVNIVVEQAAAIAASKSEVELLGGGDTQTLDVTGSDNWTAKSSADWLTATNNNSQLVLEAPANTDSHSREATVTLTDTENQTTDTVTVRQESASNTTVTTPEGYTLVWHDEFDGNSSLGSDWTHEVQSAGWVNNELQNYINSNNVTYIEDGKLNIKCYKASNGSIYSGRVYAKMDTGWKYGYMEARIKLPKGKGTWPAFWMMPANNDYTANPWPGCGEIDIMEEVGADPGQVSSTIHCTKYNNGGTATEHGSTYVADAEEEYHIYSCEWTSTNLIFYVDGKQILNYKNDGSGTDAWPFDKNFYIILNLAWGGSWGGYQGVDESALPCVMKVDYVRVFQK
jgi:beta-glucanase (GH16 family)/archaellum component FlaG (FlaF/FlaG flagellin family)